MFVAFGVLYFSPVTPTQVSQSAGGPSTALFVFPFVAFALIGALIASRQPSNPIGWLLLGAAGLLVTGALSSLIGSLLWYAHNPAASWVALGGILWSGGASPVTFVFVVALLLFPDGKLASARWRWLIVAEAVFTALTVLIVLVDPARGLLGISFTPDGSVNPPSPLGVQALAGLTGAFTTAPTTVIQYALEVAAIVSVFLRPRGADAERRHQIRWFASGAAIEIAFLIVSNFLPNPSNPTPGLIALYSIVTVVGTLAIPVAIAVAILRYRLYDIDLVINRAVVYGALAVFITVVYVGIAVGFGTLAGSGGKPNLGLSILATAIVAIGFQPARERVQRVANRLVYGQRATPYQVLSQFSSQVAGSYAADEVLPRMARVLEEGTAAERSTVWLRSGGALHAAATWPVAATEQVQLAIPISNGALPQLPGATRAVEVRHQGELLGALSLVKRRGESLTPVEEKLLDDLAHQAGLVLKNVGLTADLQRRLEELRASRQRLVSAQDAERRRLERNLHDGAQQHLVALKVKLGLAEMLAERDPEKAKETIAQLKSDADEALETLRDLARGIYPPLLAEKGLAVALESQARKATLPVTVEADGVGRYPQDVEATVYFCVLEALQNVQKYAQASSGTVRLHDRGGDLRFEVEDDGRGFDVERVKKGAGLTNMTDRVDAANGTVVVTSAPGKGTAVVGQIPTAPAPARAADAVDDGGADYPQAIAPARFPPPTVAPRMPA